MAPVALYVDGKVVRTQLFPVIRNNRRKIEFEVRIYDVGEHHLAIGSTDYQSVLIEGEKPSVVFEDFQLSNDRLIQGETVKAEAVARNLTSEKQKLHAVLFLDDRDEQSIPLIWNQTAKSC